MAPSKKQLMPIVYKNPPILQEPNKFTIASKNSLVFPCNKPYNSRSCCVGMQREKKSFRTYVELAAMVRDKQSFEMLLDIAGEEARKMLMFEMQYDKIVVDGRQP